MSILARLISAAVLFAAAPALAGSPVVLKPAPAARGASVTLGDVFAGVTGPAATVSLAKTPAAGLNAVLDATQVQRVAAAAGLDWANAQGVSRIIVSSMAAMAAGPATAAVAPAKSQAVLAYARNIMSGEMVSASDLTWSDSAVAPADAPSDADRVIGMVARRPLRLGTGVGSHDVTAAKVVHRDDTISVSYQAGGITLVLQAKAMGDAAVGESLQVLNIQSKKTIEAVASGPGQALVGPRAQSLKANPASSMSIAVR
ncbi:MAG: flagellar basal body P-ring formation chaperone FlgA [Caulobacteraceae bacterium]